MDAAAATPFERFIAPARDRAALWRLALGLLVAAAVYIGLNAVAAGMATLLAGPQGAERLGRSLAAAETPAAALALLASFVPMLVGVAAAAWLCHGRGPASLLGPGFLRGLALGVTVTLAVYLPLWALWETGYDSRPNLAPDLWIALLPLGLAAIAVQTLAEEALFRGYLAQQLAARVRSALVWGVLPALLFGLLHYDPSRMGDGAPVVVLGAALFGLAAADLTWRTGSIGLAWGVHLANNAIAILALGTPGTITGLALRLTPYGAEELGHSPWHALAELAPFVVVWLILRRLTAR